MKTYLKTSLLMLGLITALLLNACGGGGGNDDMGRVPQISNTPTLSFQQVKKFTFTWDDVDDATFYRLLENTDGESGFLPVGNAISNGLGEITIQVPLYQRINAQYILQSCNNAGCTNSDPVSVSGNLVDSIGYFKPSNDTSVVQNNVKQFGYDVALSEDGTTLAISAIEENVVINDEIIRNAGMVYIFKRTNDDFFWSLDDTVIASNAEGGDSFGKSLTLSSDGFTLAVGAPDKDNSIDTNMDSSGAVFIYKKTFQNWEQVAFLEAFNAGEDHLFGTSVDLSADGRTLVVGAKGESSDPSSLLVLSEDNSFPDSGAVYVFTFTDNDWQQQAFIKATNFSEGDEFGSSVSISGTGNTLVVGAPREDGIELISGAAYVFVRDDGNWIQTTVLKASNPDIDDRFGTIVSISANGETIAIAADREESNAIGVNGLQSDNSFFEAGAVYVFTKFGNDWDQQAYIKASNTDESDLFGESIALSADGNTLVVGAFEEDSNAKGVDGEQSNNELIDSSAAYVFKRQGDSWSQLAYLKASNPGEDNYFGFSVAISGDGETIAIGAFGEEGDSSGIGGDQNNNLTGASNGAVYLY